MQQIVSSSFAIGKQTLAASVSLGSSGEADRTGGGAASADRLAPPNEPRDTAAPEPQNHSSLHLTSPETLQLQNHRTTARST